MPKRIRSVDDFPAPFAPRNAVMRPGNAWKLTSRSTSRGPCFFVRLSIVIMERSCASALIARIGSRDDFLSMSHTLVRCRRVSYSLHWQSERSAQPRMDIPNVDQGIDHPHSFDAGAVGSRIRGCSFRSNHGDRDEWLSTAGDRGGELENSAAKASLRTRSCPMACVSSCP